MKKKFLLAFIVVCTMILSMGIINASAGTYGDLTYTVSNGEVTITDCNTSATSVDIPSTIENCPVTSIRYEVFSGCSSLTSITIPDSVTSIGRSAFEYCRRLTSITIPDSVTSIGDYAFYCCGSLTSISVETNNQYFSSKDGVLFNKNQTKLISYPAGKNETNYVISNAVTSIEAGAFSSCLSLTSITIPDSVTSIGSSAFNNTGYYNNADNWDKGVLYIGKHLIEAKTSISGSYVIRAGTKIIAEYAFFNCEGLTSIMIPDSVTSIGNDAFALCYSLTDITIPDSVTSIGDNAFANCYNLTSVILPDGLREIGDWTFWDCESLTNIIIPDSVTSIGDYAFDTCVSLTNIMIPDSVTSIGENAFGMCYDLISISVGSNNLYFSSKDGVLFNKNQTKLICCPAGKGTSYTIPDSVTSIGENAFGMCYDLISITIPDSVTSIGNDAFDFCDNIKTVYYGGTEEQWSKIVVSPLDKAEVIFNYVIPSAKTEIIGAISTDTTLKFISKAIIEGEPEIATFGTTFIPLWLFEINSTDTVTVEYNNADYDIQNGQTFGATLTSIPESFKDMEIVGKSYIKTADGNYKWSTAKYATVNNTTLRTIE